MATMPPHHPVRGAALCLASLLLFACMDTTTKYLSAHLQIPLIMAVRYSGNLLLMVLILGPREGRRIAETQRTGLVIVRSVSLASASLCFGMALTFMPVAETTAINFLAPILVVSVAGHLLGERVGCIGWMAALLGFAGVLLIARPGGGLARSACSSRSAPPPRMASISFCPGCSRRPSEQWRCCSTPR